MKTLTAGTLFTALFSTAAAALEEPSFVVIEERDGYEIRRYDSYLVAQTQIPGDYKPGSNQAFRILAGYIFGKNQQELKMAMTVPVTSQLNADGEDGKAYEWQFVMGRAYSEETLPTPVDNRVSIERVPSRLVAVRRYSGSTGEKNFRKNVLRLAEALARDGLTTRGEPIAAVYNGPFTPGFFRRNEVLVELKE
ncbi:MAG: heme-binding protein [Pseudomonadota bacterium]